MGDGFSPGHRGLGSLGDPDPDAALPEAVAEAILVGRPLDGRALRGPLGAEVRPLVETIGALRAAPTAAEFRGHAQAMAAFREVSGFAGSAGLAHTLQLEVPHRLAGRRTGRARHRAPGRTRPTGRPSAKHRLGLATAAAVALVVVLSIVAYSGYLPGPFQRAAHVAASTPGAKGSSSAPGSSRPATGPGGLAGSSATPAASPTPSTTPSPATTPSASGQPENPAKLCQAYFADPWRDLSDFTKLSKAAGGPLKVWSYCQPYLQAGPGRTPASTDGPTSTDTPPDTGGLPGSDHGAGSNGQRGSGNATSRQQAW
jgi:hypothetical protein